MTFPDELTFSLPPLPPEAIALNDETPDAMAAPPVFVRVAVWDKDWKKADDLMAASVIELPLGLLKPGEGRCEVAVGSGRVEVWTDANGVAEGVMLNGAKPWTANQIQRAFKKNDKDHSGGLDYNQLRSFIKSMGLRSNPKRVKEAIEKYDVA